MVQAGKAKTLKVQVRGMLSWRVCVPLVLKWMEWIVRDSTLHSLCFGFSVSQDRIYMVYARLTSIIAPHVRCSTSTLILPGIRPGVLACLHAAWHYMNR